jgi:DNA-binding transcriptional ArsR family regulator
MSESIDEIERVFLALSDKTRIKLLDLMRDGEVSVNYLCDSLGISQPKVSRHLAYLRTMGMVRTRRDGKWIYYSISEPENKLGSQLLRNVISWVGCITRGESQPLMPKRPVPAPSVRIVNTESDKNIYAYTDMNNDSDELEVYLL